jgi:tetratricopeptide (TPR) repeat protein
MKRGWRTLARVGPLAALIACTSVAYAQPPAPAAAASSGTADAVKQARVHFTKGRDLYQQGAYREAIAELEAARALDPKAKDLVFNLGVIHEKLGEIDDALRFLRLYAQMDLEPTELTRAENYIKRLEGAKAEVDAKKAAVTRPDHDDTQPAPRVRGRIDAATIAAGAVAVGALGAGVVFGVKALLDQPAAFAPGQHTTVSTLDQQQSSAHTEAIVSDACFAGAIAAAAVTVGLYIGRYKDPKDKTSPKATFLTVAPLIRSGGGGELLLGGTF